MNSAAQVRDVLQLIRNAIQYRKVVGELPKPNRSDVIRADMDLCLAVRSGSTAFVDYFGMLDSPDAINQEVLAELRDAIFQAKDAIDLDAHDRARDYQDSIVKKLSLIQGLSQGQSFQQAILAAG